MRFNSLNIKSVFTYNLWIKLIEFESIKIINLIYYKYSKYKLFWLHFHHFIFSYLLFTWISIYWFERLKSFDGTPLIFFLIHVFGCTLRLFRTSFFKLREVRHLLDMGNSLYSALEFVSFELTFFNIVLFKSIPYHI